jgi:hypothetical protein
MTVVLEGSSDLAADWQVSDAPGLTISDDGRQLSFEVNAGTAYQLGLGTARGIGHYQMHFTGESRTQVTDLGTVTQARFDDQALAAEGSYFTATAARDGLLTVEAFFETDDGDAHVELYDAQMNRLAGSIQTGTGAARRVDVTVDAGATVYVHVSTGDASHAGTVDLRLTNLVTHVGDRVTVFGTPGDDAVTLQAGAAASLVINGVDYSFDAETFTSIDILTDGARDTLVLHGTSADERIRLSAGGVVMTGDGWTASATGVESITAYGGGGADRGELIDSVASDTFTAGPEWAEMIGGGYQNRLYGCHHVTASATRGGTDIARLYDSSAADVFLAGPESARLLGGGSWLQANRFEQVHAYSISGGRDMAKLFDSRGDDLFTAGPDAAAMSGTGYLNRAVGFRAADGYALAGGLDVARLTGSDGDDTFRFSERQAQLIGDGFQCRAVMFEQLHADAMAGHDHASLDDTSGNDRLTARRSSSELRTVDAAVFALAFESVDVRSTHGGDDRAEINAVDYTLQLTGDWEG